MANIEWIEPITNRTQADVNYVKTLNTKIRKNGFSNLTTEEQEAWKNGLIGALNAVDLNRIENNIKYLHEVLFSYGYLSVIQEKTEEWEISSLPMKTELERIKSNLENIINNYNTPKQSVPQSVDYPTYATINELEQVIFQLNNMIGLMEKSFRYCGTFYCGESLILPEGGIF